MIRAEFVGIVANAVPDEFKEKSKCAYSSPVLPALSVLRLLRS
jgi:hypothetical protein